MPESPTALSIRDKVEALALAWHQLRVAALSVSAPADVPLWAGVSAVRRKHLADRKFPRVVFDSTRAPEDEAVEGLYRVELQIYLGTDAMEPVPAGAENLASAHTRRAGFLEEIFGFGVRADFLAWVASADCPVKGIAVYDIFIEEGMGDQTESNWFDQLTFSVVAALRNEA